MHKDGYWTEFRLKNQLTEVEREFFKAMTRRRQPAPQGSPPPAEEKSEATLRSVSTADLKLITERKYCYIDSALGFQT